ncbi:MAG: AmmeMemoRadiSam system radical SAM enzyme [Planctomycetes bacterium]|nr:AmmeMemoRadiSam system radical SAM enzyme [Planctomycetota bacterium]
MKEALYYEKLGEKKVRCGLCPQFCRIEDGKTGFCRGRRNREGTLYAETYGKCTSIAMDPIEKKPLYHFHPGTHILSLGTLGCNFACDFCQNWQISQAAPPLQDIRSTDAVNTAQRENSIGIAYTYNEPLIWYEFVLDTAKLVHEKGMKNVLVTNGYINPDPLEKLLPLIDAMNIDIKSINPTFYKERCKGKLGPVQATAKRAVESCHVEITNLIIPEHNDSKLELGMLADWISENLGEDVPVHLSAYSPRHKLQAKPTNGETLTRAYKIFKERLNYVYVGNMLLSVGAETNCRQCGATLIARRGYQISIRNLSEGKCGVCGAQNNIVT